MKINVKKQKQTLILVYIFEMMIAFLGLMKITGNYYGVLKNYKKSMILRLLLTYW